MGKTWKMPPPIKKPAYVAPAVDFVSGSNNGEVVRCIGADALIANLMMLPQIARDAANREMAMIAHDVIIDAQVNYVPVDTGDLLRSGDSDEASEGTTQAVNQIAMWFGGELTGEQLSVGVKDVRAYALEQHENMEFKHHDATRPQAGAKYLEKPFLAAVPTVGPRIANAVAEAMGLNPSFVAFGLLSTNEPITMVDPNTGGPK